MRALLAQNGDFELVGQGFRLASLMNEEKRWTRGEEVDMMSDGKTASYCRALLSVL